MIIAVLARLDPPTGLRRSRTSTERDGVARDEAISAPLIPAPTIATS
jgi:hypothetical protein